MTVNVETAAGVASRWLQMNQLEAEQRACIVLDVDAVYLRADDGRAVLVGADLRPLLAAPGRTLVALVADFAAGARSDYGRGRGAA